MQNLLQLLPGILLPLLGTTLGAAMVFLARLASLVLQVSGLTFMDRFLGALFGLLKGALIALVLVLVCGMTRIPQQPFWQNAMFSPAAESAARMVMPYLPDYFVAYIHY